MFLCIFLISCKESVPIFSFDYQVNEITLSTSEACIEGIYEVSEDIKYICIIYGKDHHLHNAFQKEVKITDKRFEVEINDLYPDTEYYFYFICDKYNVAEPDIKSFRTKKVLLPIVSTRFVTDVTTSSVVSGGNVLSDGGDNVFARGVCWSLDEKPTFDDEHTDDGAGEGIYTSEIINLTPNTTYYIRAYAINSQGIAYGEQRMFTTISHEQEIEYKTIRVNEIEFNMIKVIGSDYYMGAQSSNSDGINYDVNAAVDESPVHYVSLDDFYIGETEVTQELWYVVMGNNPSDFKSPKRPVENVSFYDCQEFIKQLNELTGLVFKLPTEAQWEYAARGGKNTNNFIYSGSDAIDDVAWYYGNLNSSAMMTQIVGTKMANELGIYDMTGNLYEWCQDWYSDVYYQNSEINNPSGPLCGNNRVIRGGSFYFIEEYCRVSSRYYEKPDNKNNSIGFRLVL